MSNCPKRDGDDAPTAISPGSETNELSDYEKARACNIERNNARLRELGLISALEERRSNDAAWGRRSEIPAELGDVSDKEDEDDDQEWVDPRRPSTYPPVKKRRKQSADAPVEGSRKSLRLRGVGADGTELPSETPNERRDRLMREREETVRECREVRLRAARAVAEAGAEKAARENPTATYEHCLMRCRTMMEKKLANRVKAIERAVGRHCVVKMAIFKSCLQDEGKWELAKLAGEALERLKGLQPPTE